MKMEPLDFNPMALEKTIVSLKKDLAQLTQGIFNVGPQICFGAFANRRTNLWVLMREPVIQP